MTATVPTYFLLQSVRYQSHAAPTEAIAIPATMNRSGTQE